MKYFHLLICLILLLTIDSRALVISDSLVLEITPAITSQKDTINFSAVIYYDYLHIPLSNFENDSQLDTCFSWSVNQSSKDLNFTNFIDSIGPHCSLITHDSGYFTIKIRCVFHWSSVFLEDTCSIRIINPSLAYKISIESNYDPQFSPYDPVPLTLIDFNSHTDTIHVYSIKRDHFGNYISPCKNCTWVSPSYSFGIKKGSDSLGEVLIFPVSSMGNGMLYCCDSLGVTISSVQLQITIPTAIKNLRQKDLVSNVPFPNRTYNVKGQKINGKVSKSIYVLNNGKSNFLFTNLSNKSESEKPEPRKVYGKAH
jgi:hypothetical protein